MQRTIKKAIEALALPEYQHLSERDQIHCINEDVLGWCPFLPLSVEIFEGNTYLKNQFKSLCLKWKLKVH